jgi:hypothetical protein
MGKKENTAPASDVPAIRRTIDGRTYTVLIHFSSTNKETAQDKIRRMLKNDVQSEAFRKDFKP